MWHSNQGKSKPVTLQADTHMVTRLLNGRPLNTHTVCIAIVNHVQFRHLNQGKNKAVTLKADTHML